ncbi:carboxypeptidase-like regulatory domain-containing protein [Paludisphaera sp.]|uniref:carboxypeptidase-like regulatory domain-containing protein n=1 Tax=Paludisphaera sp. TaxID=2017432 RepID=UPI00301B956E
MRSRGIRPALLAAALVAIGAGREASAYDVWVETVDWIPTSSVVGAPLLPTATVVSPAYVSPTVYATTYVDEPILAPTSYVATSGYVVPTYYETRFRRSLFGRRLIPTGTRAVYATSYFPTTLYYPSAYVLPTSYAAPTVIDRGVVATAYLAPTGACCGDAVLAPTSTARVVPAEPAPAPRRVEQPSRPAPRAQADDYRDDDAPALSSEVEDVPSPSPAPRTTPAPPVRSTPNPAATPPAAADPSPPSPQPVEREKSTARPEEPAPAPAPAASPRVDDAPPPDLPDDDFLPVPAPADGLGMATRREVRRPSTYDAVDRARRNILFGRVRERDTGEAEEGVRVTLTSRGGAYEDRAAMSDAFGRFAVRVPDGDWTVRVAMPSGRVYAVSEITVSNGLIVDSEGRDVPSLTITR